MLFLENFLNKFKFSELTFEEAEESVLRNFFFKKMHDNSMMKLKTLNM